MKRLFRIGFSTFIQSIIPILSWFLLGLTLDASLVNIFSITYPMQFIASIIKEIFGTGANIKQEKENNKNAVSSGIILGIVVGGIVFALFCIFSEQYLTFMSMDIATYKIFTIYSFLQIYISMVFQIIIEKFYFEDKDKKALIYTIIFNILNLVSLIGVSLITKRQLIVAITTLCILATFTLVLFALNIGKFKLDFNILTNIKYESDGIVAYIFMFVSYFFGYSTIFSFGAEYITAINFISLISDPQWDAYESMTIVAKIDIVHNNYNIKRHLKNGLIYASTLVLSVIILFFSLFNFYDVNFKIGLYFLLFQLTDLFICLPCYIVAPYIQLQHSYIKNTTNDIICYITRALLSVFLPTPYCCDIGQLSVSVISIIFYIIIFAKYYKINKDGTIEDKPRKINDQNKSNN